MHLRFSFFQPSSHFPWDTHSKQSFHLDEEGFLWLRILSIFVGPFMHLMSYLHAFCASCIYLYALFYFFILLLYFWFMWVKNPKSYKKWKIQKVWSYMFEHISHVNLALYFVQMALCIYELSVFFIHLFLCRKNLNIFVWLL